MTDDQKLAQAQPAPEQDGELAELLDRVDCFVEVNDDHRTMREAVAMLRDLAARLRPPPQSVGVDEGKPYKATDEDLLHPPRKPFRGESTALRGSHPAAVTEPEVLGYGVMTSTGWMLRFDTEAAASIFANGAKVHTLISAKDYARSATPPPLTPSQVGDSRSPHETNSSVARQEAQPVAWAREVYGRRILEIQAGWKPTGTDWRPLIYGNTAPAPEQEARDAARYRWLREHSWLDRAMFRTILHFGPGYCQTKPEFIDAAIDSAMAAPPKEPT